MFYFFVVAVVLLPSVMATATFGVSKYLTIMRSVSEQDKDVALMLVQVLAPLVAMLPVPPIFANILDNSCVFPGDGDCELYDHRTMTQDFYFGLIILIQVIIVFETLIFLRSKNFKLYG